MDTTKKKIVLTFPPQLIDRPVTWELIHDYRLKINILKAKVTPGKTGQLTLEVEGPKDNFRRAMEYIEKIGVGLTPLVTSTEWIRENCTHCTACLPICPTGALTVDRETMEVTFIGENCITCGNCQPVCGYHAIKILY